MGDFEPYGRLPIEQLGPLTLAPFVPELVDSSMLFDRSPDIQPLVRSVAAMERDHQTRAECARFIGSVLSKETVESPQTAVEQDPEASSSLLEALCLAQMGSEKARKVAELNVRTDVIERVYKAGHVLKVPLEMTPHGKLIQYGQTLDDVYRNTLYYAVSTPEMQERAELEILNGYRKEELYNRGLLDEYVMVVFSPYPDNMTDERAAKTGFFRYTKSCVIQATTAQDNALQCESAFVAGVTEAGGSRHDIDTIVKLAATLGVDVRGKTATEILGTPLLIHKSLMPNGVIDIVALYDQAAGGTFFGQKRAQQNYLHYLEQCRQRERALEPTVQKVVQQLLLEAHTFKDPLEANRRLHELSQAAMVDYAIDRDVSIDPRVFGPAAAHIEWARYYQNQGDAEAAATSRTQAQAKAQSSSCPTDGSRREEDDNTKQPADKKEADDKNGKINCIKCRQQVSKRDVVKTNCWECPLCKHKVDICTGKVLREGVVEKPKTTALHGPPRVLQKT